MSGVVVEVACGAVELVVYPRVAKASLRFWRFHPVKRGFRVDDVSVVELLEAVVDAALGVEEFNSERERLLTTAAKLIRLAVRLVESAMEPLRSKYVCKRSEILERFGALIEGKGNGNTAALALKALRNLYPLANKLAMLGRFVAELRLAADMIGSLERQQPKEPSRLALIHVFAEADSAAGIDDSDTRLLELIEATYTKLTLEKLEKPEVAEVGQ